MHGRRLNELGLKATRPRLRVLEALLSSRKRHLSAEDIHRRVVDAGSRVGLASIYRILAQLEAAGALRKHVFEAGVSVFELDGGDCHDHLVCVSCGRVDDFQDRAIRLRRQKIADEHGFDVSDEPLMLRGLCAGCARKRRTPAAQRAGTPAAPRRSA
ncbi:Fur family transcriptional regulator [Sphaerotilus sp.]|uniref:Fur family transcriptional regulator n=1 Tax=Sphaerotilus sp. TaxID=2093942 RepID=UPI002ACD40D1|nr:Fur family transcriptional regulator [Sphaerotilus sp.]MDZ7855908.1 Fur family transcriptional regulator [Sphaerotilus sp.]